MRKERLSSDSEVQLLEDVSCLVFLAFGLSDFMAKTEDKLARILAKTWGKMSEAGRRHALMLVLPPSVPDLLERGLAALSHSLAAPQRREDAADQAAPGPRNVASLHTIPEFLLASV